MLEFDIGELHTKIMIPELNNKTCTFINISGINTDPRCVSEDDMPYIAGAEYPEDYVTEIAKIHAKFVGTYIHTFSGSVDLAEIVNAIRKIKTSQTDYWYELFHDLKIEGDKIYVEFDHGS